MKKILMVAAALAWASTASAKHERNSQTCYDCHTMHASISHEYTAATAFTKGSAQTFGANGYVKLLQRDGTNATCLGCHDAEKGGHNTDVYGADTVTYQGARSAGGLNGQVNGFTLDAGYADYMGHTLGSLTAPPGFNNAAAWPTANDEGLTCAKCHAVHGGALDSFRHLGGVADMGWKGVKYQSNNPYLTNYPTKNPAATFDATYDVTVLASATDSKGSRDARRIVYGVGGNGLNKYCGVCHGNFHGDANVGTKSDIGFRRHPTSGQTRNAADWFVSGAQVGSTIIGGVVRPAWADASGGTFQVNCTSCHKAHGNKHAFGLIWPTNAAVTATTNYEEGDGAVYQDLCATCHVQAQTTAYKTGNGFTPVDTFINGVSTRPN
jgi:hypothetical protein